MRLNLLFEISIHRSLTSPRLPRPRTHHHRHWTLSSRQSRPRKGPASRHSAHSTSPTFPVKECQCMKLDLFVAYVSLQAQWYFIDLSIVRASALNRRNTTASITSSVHRGSSSISVTSKKGATEAPIEACSYFYDSNTIRMCLCGVLYVFYCIVLYSIALYLWHVCVQLGSHILGF